MTVVTLSLVFDFGPGRAHVTGRSWPSIPKPGKKLHLNRDRPVLLFRHGSGILRMKHHATVEERVVGRAGLEGPCKPVLDDQVKPGEGLLIVKVSELVVKVAVLIVPHFDHAIFYTEGVTKVLTGLVMVDFYDPVVYVLPVEEFDPAVVLARRLLILTSTGKNSSYNEGMPNEGSRSHGDYSPKRLIRVTPQFRGSPRCVAPKSYA